MKINNSTNLKKYGRRNFIKAASLTAAGLSIGVNDILAKSNASSQSENKKFKMKFAPHFGMFENSAGKN